MRRLSTPALLALAALLLGTGPALAVIKKLTPLAEVLKSEIILVAEVESVAPDKPAVTFKVTEQLKGKSPTEKFIVSLAGDNFAKKDKHQEVMLERLATGRKLVLILEPGKEKYFIFGYIEGTWFQMQGTVVGEKIIWSFLHCEPYFRRTFKGTTEELRTVISECLAGKSKPPEPNEKEPHGYGPPADKAEKKDPKDAPDKKDTPDKKDVPQESKSTPQANGRHTPAGFVSGPLFGVIPSIVLVGPLALLSALFPSIFAGLASGLKRWRGFLMIASANSLLTGLYMLIVSSSYLKLPDSRIYNPATITALVVLINLVGIAWAGRRYRRAALEDPGVTAPPVRSEVAALAGFLAAVAIMLVLIAWGFGLSWSDLVSMPTREFTAIGVGLAAALLHSLYRIATRRVDADSTLPLRLSAPGEAVAIAGMLIFALVMFVYDLPGKGSDRFAVVAAGDAATGTALSPKLTDAVIWYEDPDSTEIYSSLHLTPDRAFFGSIETKGVRTVGVVVCFDQASGSRTRLWKYSDDDLKSVYSTPVLAGDRVYFGEGLHTDSGCRMICLDAKAGGKLWEKKTTSHTEGTPVVLDGRVYFSAGDDGIYCQDAISGADVWHFQGLEQQLHIDTHVRVAGGKVFAGSGYNTTAALCLDAATGKELWRKELPLRSFGQPLLVGKHIVYGLGTGNLIDDLSTEDEPNKTNETKAAGQIMCLEADSGKTVWTVDLPKSVHTEMVADARAIYACCKDGSVLALDRATGNKIWSVGFGSEFSSGPAVATVARGAATVAVYVVTNDGNVSCLDPLSGKPFWSRNIQDAVGRKGVVHASSIVKTIGADGGVRELYVPATLTRKNGQTFPSIVRFTDEIRE